MASNEIILTGSPDDAILQLEQHYIEQKESEGKTKATEREREILNLKRKLKERNPFLKNGELEANAIQLYEQHELYPDRKEEFYTEDGLKTLEQIAYDRGVYIGPANKTFDEDEE